jgi:hypothetical protein
LQSSTLKAKTMWRVNAIGYQWWRAREFASELPGERPGHL